MWSMINLAHPTHDLTLLVFFALIKSALSFNRNTLIGLLGLLWELTIDIRFKFICWLRLLESVSYEWAVSIPVLSDRVRHACLSWVIRLTFSSLGGSDWLKTALHVHRWFTSWHCSSKHFQILRSKILFSWLPRIKSQIRLIIF